MVMLGGSNNPFAKENMAEALKTEPIDQSTRNTSPDYKKAMKDALKWIEDYEKEIKSDKNPATATPEQDVETLGIFFNKLFANMVGASKDYKEALQRMITWQAKCGSTLEAGKFKEFLMQEIK